MNKGIDGGISISTKPSELPWNDRSRKVAITRWRELPPPAATDGCDLREIPGINIDPMYPELTLGIGKIQSDLFGFPRGGEVDNVGVVFRGRCQVRLILFSVEQ